MDDLEGMLSGLLSSPDAMEKLSEAASRLGLGSRDGEEKSPPTPDLSSLAGLLPALSGGGKDNRYTRLLKALAPFLSERRRARLEEAEKMLGFFDMAQAVSGLMGRTGGGEDK